MAAYTARPYSITPYPLATTLARATPTRLLPRDILSRIRPLNRLDAIQLALLKTVILP